MTTTHSERKDEYQLSGIGDHLDMMLVFNLLRTQNRIEPAIDGELKNKGLTGPKFNALLALDAAGDNGLLMSEIGERLVVSKSNITGLVDRLESQNLVQRCPDADRRAIRVKLTDVGRALTQEILPVYRRVAEDLADCLEPEEKRTLIALLSKLRRELRRRQGKGCCV
ncbi:MAG: MarR family transcriptional regulator [Planctomycetota bacterium]